MAEKKIFKLFYFLIAFLFICLSVGFGFKYWPYTKLTPRDFAYAEYFNYGPPASGHNIQGFAWSSTFGWVSFNADDCDQDNNGFVDNINQCGGDNTTDILFDYGVHIDRANNGELSGYAWSNNIGWISFERATAGAPPFADPGGSGIAYYDKDTGTIRGWANALILSVGLADDGWISFNADDCDNNGVNYLGTPAGCPPAGTNYHDYGAWIPEPKAEDHPYFIALPGPAPINAPPAIEYPAAGSEYRTDNNRSYIHGWAWSNNDIVPGLGWISFNCDDDPTCSHPYKVTVEINRPPRVVINPGANPAGDDWEHEDNGLCAGYVSMHLFWTFEDDDPEDALQSAYRIQITLDSDGGFATPIVDYSSGFNSNVQDFVFTEFLGAQYATDYIYRVMVFDEFGVSSDWLNPAVAFRTPEHKYPEPYFSWFPEIPSENEEAMFTSSSTCYQSLPLNTPYRCWDPSNVLHAGSEWEWLAVNPGPHITIEPIGQVTDIATSTIKFADVGALNGIEMTVWDNNAYSCSTTSPDVMNLNVPLPTWIER